MKCYFSIHAVWPFYITVPDLKGDNFNQKNYTNKTHNHCVQYLFASPFIIDSFKSMIHSHKQMLGIFPCHALLGLCFCCCLSLYTLGFFQPVCLGSLAWYIVYYGLCIKLATVPTLLPQYRCKHLQRAILLEACISTSQPLFSFKNNVSNNIKCVTAQIFADLTVLQS